MRMKRQCADHNPPDSGANTVAELDHMQTLVRRTSRDDVFLKINSGGLADE